MFDKKETLLAENRHILLWVTAKMGTTVVIPLFAEPYWEGRHQAKIIAKLILGQFCEKNLSYNETYNL